MLPAGKLHRETSQGAVMKWALLPNSLWVKAGATELKEMEPPRLSAGGVGAYMTNTTAALEWSARLSEASKFIQRAQLSEPPREIFKNSLAPTI